MSKFTYIAGGIGAAALVSVVYRYFTGGQKKPISRTKTRAILQDIMKKWQENQTIISQQERAIKQHFQSQPEMAQVHIERLHGMVEEKMRSEEAQVMQQHHVSKAQLQEAIDSATDDKEIQALVTHFRAVQTKKGPETIPDNFSLDSAIKLFTQILNVSVVVMEQVVQKVKKQAGAGASELTGPMLARINAEYAKEYTKAREEICKQFGISERLVEAVVRKFDGEPEFDRVIKTGMRNRVIKFASMGLAMPGTLGAGDDDTDETI